MILTKEEKAWVKRLNKLLAQCPSDRMRFFTIGDSEIFIANNDTAEQWDLANGDPLLNAQRQGSVADESIHFPNAVEGVCG